MTPPRVYKNTDLPWLDQIPIDWKTSRAKAIFRLVTEKSSAAHGMELLSVYTHIGVRPRKDLEQRGNKASNTDGYWLVKRGDIVVNKLLAWMGAVGVSHYEGVTSPAYDILRPRVEVITDYYHFLFRTPLYLQLFKSRSRGIMDMRLRLYFDQFGQLPIPVPPVEEQVAIVQYLNFITRKITKVIAAKRQLIKTLNESKLSIVRSTVLKGLDPNVFGISIGPGSRLDGPPDWGVLRLKYVTRFSYGESLPALKRSGAEFVVYGSNGPVGKSSASNTLEPTIIVGRKGSYGKVNFSKSKCFAIDTTYFIDSRNTHNDLRWLYYLLQVIDLDKLSQDTGVPGLSRENAYQKIVPVPALSVQQEIALKLDVEVQRVDRVISVVAESVNKLVEYQSRIITDVVTGRLDVRNAAADLPREDEPLSSTIDVRNISGIEDDNEFSEVQP